MADPNKLLMDLLAKLNENVGQLNENFAQLASRVQNMEDRMSGEKASPVDTKASEQSVGTKASGATVTSNIPPGKQQDVSGRGKKASNEVQSTASVPAVAPVSVLPPAVTAKPQESLQQEVSTPHVNNRTARFVPSFTFGGTSSPPSDLDMYGPTGLLNTPHNNAFRNDTLGGDRNPRRHSIHQHGLIEAEKNASHVITYGVRESYDHIRLKSRTARAFFQFWEDVVLYERRTKSLLQVPTLLSDDMRDAVVALDPVKYGNLKFYDLSHEDLYGALQSLFRPRSRLHFYNMLKEHVDFVYSSHNRPTPAYFGPFYTALLRYQQLFIKYYEIFALNNSEQNIPECNTREYGLIKLFISKIPHEYGSRTLSILGSQKWPNIYAFKRDFMGQVENDKLAGEEARRLAESFGGTQYEAGKHETPKPKPSPWQGKVQAIENMSEEVEEELEIAVADEESDDYDEEIVFHQDLQALQYPHAPKPSAAPSAHAPSNKEPFICILKVLYGTCNKAGCKYEHREDPVHKQRVKYLDLIQKQMAQNKPSGAQRFPQRSSNIDEALEEDQDY
mmetsp:Transcript_54430/g.95062  ORF Transcript_54430/g.95062 Transcript_54430/m.95062 type:complete len:561 (+) Transcript_54430:3916-5598(+)